MKVILSLLYLLLFSCWATAVYSSETTINLSKQESIDSFMRDCGFKLGDKLASTIIFSTGGVGNPGREPGTIDYKNYIFYSQIKPQKMTRKIKFVLSADCPEYDIGLKKIDPKSIIKEREYAGRNYSHVKWQKNYTGLNWKGKIAYIDYISGDNERNVSIFLICQLNSAKCINFGVTEPKKTTSKERTILLELFKDIALAPANSSKPHAPNP